MKLEELKQVIDELYNNLPPDTEIILQKDAEGNGHSPLSSINSNAIYIPTSTWSGNVYNTKLTAKENGLNPDQGLEIISRYPKAIILSPVN